MKVSRMLTILVILLLSLGLVSVSLALAQSQSGPRLGPPEGIAAAAAQEGETPDGAGEAAKAAATERDGVPERAVQVNQPANIGPLFVGVDDVTVPAYTIDISTNAFYTAFVGTEVWGAAYDGDNNRVLFSDGTDLYEWSLSSGTVTFLSTISDTTGTNVSMEGLAYYSGTLYASKTSSTGEGEGIYQVDLVTFQATRVITYTDANITIIGGLDADPVTGQLYGTNDDTDLRGLVQIDPDGTVTLLAPYRGGETDVDGLAVGDGKAFLITDDNTPQTFDVFDFGVMTYTGVITNPWTSSEVFAGGAWIELAPASISEIRIDQPGTDNDEYFELAGNAGASLDGWTYIVIGDGAGGSGVIEAVVDLTGTVIPADGYFLALEDTSVYSPSADLILSGTINELNFENSDNVTHLFVSGFSGALNDDLDTDDDGVLDVTPWDQIGDCVALIETVGSGDQVYCSTTVGPDGSFVPAHVFACPAGWQIGPFDPVGGMDTPGSANPCFAPSISLAKTVGTDPNACAASSSIFVPAGSDVTYCYEVTNTGNVTETLHDLVDSQLGSILSGFNFSLSPGSTVFLTQSVNLTQSVVNTATWTAYNPGPSDMVSDTDSATVNIIQSAPIGTCADFESGALPPFMYPLTTSSPPANGRVQVTTAYPHTGSYALDIDTDCDGCGGATQQAGVMVVDLAGQPDVILDFWVYEHGDENNPEDGVFISDDGGATWFQILSLNNFPASYQQVSIDLDAAAAGVGVNLVDGFQIKFQSLDNFSIPTDGYSFDDICVLQPLPEIQLQKTVGTDPNTCATGDTIGVLPGTDVTYCYEVTNTGFVTLTQHDLVDSELGTLLSTFPFTLTPGSSAFLTATATITQEVTNTAIWTAYNPGPTDVVTASDIATVTLVLEPEIVVDPASLAPAVPQTSTLTSTLTISNVGLANLDWEILEEPATSAPQPTGAPSAPAATPSAGYEGPVVTSAADCAAFANYPGAEPPGYAEFCVGPTERPAPATNAPLAPTDTGYAQDIGFVSDNFVRFTLNDFPGQTVLGANTRLLFGYDFDPTASTLYALENTTQELGTIDLATGAFTAIGSSVPLAGHTWSGLTIDPITGVFYASSTDGATSALYTLDPATGTPTLVGTTTTAPLLIDIAMSPSGVLYGHDIGSDSIYTIDPTTGAATLVGQTGYNANFAQGMDFDNDDGTLYIFLYQGGGANVYGTVDLTSGAVTPLAVDNPLGEFEGATQTVAVTCNSGDIPWVSVSPISGTTAVGSASTVDVVFDSTGLAAGTYTGTLCVTSNDPLNPLVRVPLTMTVVARQYGVALSADMALSGTVGSTVTYTVDITNTGNVADVFDLTSAGETWTTTLSTNAITLNAGESGSFTVMVDIPASASDGANDTVTVTATSQGDPAASDSVDLTTTVIVTQRFIYLPRIFKLFTP